MKVKYDQEVDVLIIQLSGAPVEESDEDKPGVILDYDKDVEGQLPKENMSATFFEYDHDVQLVNPSTAKDWVRNPAGAICRNDNSAGFVWSIWCAANPTRTTSGKPCPALALMLSSLSPSAFSLGPMPAA